MPEFITYFPDTYLPSKGINLFGVNTNCLADSANRTAVSLFVHQDGNLTAPTFSNTTVLSLRSESTATGHNSYRSQLYEEDDITPIPGTVTTAKHSFIPFSVYASHKASGQRLLTGYNQEAFGMGDSCISMFANYYWGGPVAGDEGQGIQLVSYLSQGKFLQKGAITAILAKSTLDTTTTQVIAQSLDLLPQSVTVASSAGAVVGDWVVIEQLPDDGTPVIEAVQITAVNAGGANRISAVFLNNHPSGVKVRPATLLRADGANGFGQDRVIVNMSSTPYATGTITSVSGGTLIGTGTTWSATMVGGHADNVGAISLAVDDYTGSPFDTGSGRLRSWHQITAVTDATHLAVHSWSVAGDASYKGRGTVASNLPSTYTIRPAMRMLNFKTVGGSGAMICEYSSHTWTVGDIVECAMCPYPDVQGYQYSLSQWTPNGANNKGFFSVYNSGARTYDFCFYIGAGMASGAGWAAAQADNVGFNKGILINSCTVPIQIGWGSHQQDMSCAIQLSSVYGGFGALNDNGSKIDFGTGYIMANSTNVGLKIAGVTHDTLGVISFLPGAITGESEVRLDYTGSARLHGWLDLEEKTAPPALANYVRIFAEDNGAGKTRVMAQFGTGAAVQMAIQP